MSRLVRRLYSALYCPAAPFVAGYLATRADSRGRWRDYFGENSFDGAPPAPGGPWVHAVSAGEVLSVAPVVRELRARLPELPPATLTTTIQDALDVASRRAADLFPSRTFLPLDLERFQVRLARALQPRLMLLSETDFWPNLLALMRAGRVPVYLVNGRISRKAGMGYRLARPLLAPAFAACRLLFVQREADAERLAAAGAPDRRIRIRPNTKFERVAGPPEPSTASSRYLTASGRPVLVAGSTHEGEERLVLEAAAGVSGLLTVLAPRNPGRAERVAALAPRALLWSRRTGDRVPDDVECVVLDTMGELDSVYAAATVAIVGGSFGRHHGHNFLEPAWHGRAIVCGPDMANFEADLEPFTAADAVAQVPDGVGLIRRVRALLADPAAAARMGAQARRLVEAGQGVSARLAEEIASDLAEYERTQSPLRVLVAVSSGGIGGGERQALVTMEAMREEGLAVPTLACRGGGWLEAEARRRAIPVVPMPFRTHADAWTFGRLAAALLLGDFDLLHTHLNVASFLGGLASRVAGMPAVATMHGLSATLPYGFADRLIAVSRAVETYCRDLAPWLSSEIATIHSGLPPFERPSGAAVARFRQALGIEPGELVFTAIGKLHANKNQLLLVQAAKCLPRAVPWRILLVGSGRARSHVAYNGRGLGERLIFAGELDETPVVLAASDMLVVPSRHEAFGLVALEAQMAGTPVAAAATGGLLEIVDDGVTGRTFPVDDVAALARILEACIRDAAPFRLMAEAARLTVFERFSVGRTARSTAAEYRAAMRGW